MQIIKKAAQVSQTNSLLITGKKAHGTTTMAVREAMQYENVLYVAFANMPTEIIPETWDVAEVSDGASFDMVMTHLKTNKYDCLIFDDYNAATAFYLPKNSTPSQKEYGEMSAKLNTRLVEAKANVPNFICTAKVVMSTPSNDSDIPQPKLFVTPATYNLLLMQFPKVWFNFVRRNSDKTGYDYYVQKHPIAAMDFDTKAGNPEQWTLDS